MNIIELEKKYHNCRNAILLVVVFTIVNVGMILYNRSYFLFSLSFPRFVIFIVEYMVEEQGFVFEQSNYFIVVAIMLLPIVLFGLSYVFTSNYRYKGFTLAIIILGFDSIFTLLSLDIVDIGFHIYIFVVLFLGIKHGRKLKISEHQDQVVISNNNDLDNDLEYNDLDYQFESNNTPVLRNDTSKGRVLLETTYKNLDIVVKRRKGLTELIINEKVYDEAQGIIETNYQLSANINNVNVVFDFDGFRMKIYANNTELINKLRLF